MMALLCKVCKSTLASLASLILAEVPPSQTHLAVDFRDPNAESRVYEKVNKIPNDATGKKGADRCPFELHCKACREDCKVTLVGKVTVVAKKNLLCFKTENVIFKCGTKELNRKKLKAIKDELIQCGICVVNVPYPECQPEAIKHDPVPTVYGDVNGLRPEDILVLTHDTPRDYQIELFEKAMFGNSLVYLPTGSGKTLIAAMVMSCMARLNLDKLMVFVVDKVPLAHQQSKYLKHQVPGLKVKVITGEPELNGAPRHDQRIEQDLAEGRVNVLVLTHQILLNFLASQTTPIRMSDISVLVLDEAHHCTKNHPYNEIMSKYKETPNRYKPLVLALTASPAGERTMERSIEKLEGLLSNLCGASLLKPEKPLVLRLDFNSPDLSCQVVTLTDKQVLLRGYIHTYARILVLQIEREALCQDALQFLDVFSTNFRGALWKILERHHGGKYKKARALGEHAVHVVTGHEISTILGFESALQSLEECLSRLEFASSPMEKMKKATVTNWESYRILREFVRREHRREHHTPVFSRPSSGKLQHLEREMEKFVCRVQEDEKSRGIVFVKMRKTAYMLCEELKKIPSVSKTLHPAYFVGHGQGSDGMVWQGEQEEVLRRFHSGKTKLLISTNVLEEGLDVPICNLVVRFDSALSLRSLVQSRGRASRRAGSTFAIICDEDEKKKLRDAIAMEKNMDQAVDTVRQRNGPPRCQAELFDCERKEPDLSSPVALAGASDEDAPWEGLPGVEKYTPRIKVAVHNVATDDDQRKVIRFFNGKFEVESFKPSQDIQKVDLELEASTDHKECRSKEEFYDLVTETWCTNFNIPEAEPGRLWLQRNEPHTGKASKTPVTSLMSAECLSIGYFLHQTHFCRQWPAINSLKRVSTTFEHDLRMLTVKFTAPSEVDARGRHRFKAEIRYNELEEFILVDRGKSPEPSVNLFISVRRPPRLFKESDVMEEDDDGNDSDDSAFEDSSSDSEYTTDEEFPDVGQNHQSDHPGKGDPVWDPVWERVSDVGDSSGDWGECLVYHLVFDPDAWVRVNKVLTSLTRFDKKVHFAAVKVEQRSLPAVDIPRQFPFDLQYAIKCLFTSHPVVRGRITARFTSLLDSKPDKALAAIERLTEALERDKFCDPESKLESLLNQTCLKSSGMSPQLLPSHCALIKRLVVTPTRMLFYAPEVMCKNRVLRNYDSSKFLCVNVRDEDFSKLSSAGGSIDPVLQRLKEILDHGVDFSGHHFQYLGSSNSQLRSHGCWFVEHELQPDEIREWMGDFSSIRCVASFVARMGQCFSTSMDAVGIEVDQEASWVEEEDVKTADGKYCFSDGVGTISPELSRQVVKKIAKDFVPSAYQIRFAGYKGVLCEDPKLRGKTARFRQSMRKFQSPHRRLEVLQTSRPQVVYLNHQVIMLLSNLGVPDAVFFKLQTGALDCLADMLVDERRAVQQMTSAARTGIAYAKLSEGGLALTVEPFFKSLLVAVYRERFHNLLSRARIQLPPAKARLMMGVMDEADVLHAGQVFVQYSAVSDDPEKEFSRSDKRVLTGRAVVGRNPCLHPGDFKTLTAVDKPQLRHLVDCVVFPRRGPRPHPNEMAGGDLDGDLYFVCWHEGLLPRKPDHPPMDYDALPKKEEPGPITVSHMTKHFVDYIRFDQLGVIDNAHKALADKLEDGVESALCLQLAECHSHAVDAPKTGKWPKLPRACAIPEFPDFMMKTDKPSYQSEKVLGELYRKCRAFQEKSAETTKPGSNRKPPLDRELLVEGYEKFREGAQETYSDYREQLETLMNLYGVDSEAELMTGSFMKLRNRLGKEKNEICKILSQLLSLIRSKYRKEFFKQFGLDATQRRPEEVVSLAMQQKASAWYVVAYDCGSGLGPGSAQDRRLLGFPWLVDDVILGIRRRRQANQLAPRSPVHIATLVSQSLTEFYCKEKESLLDDYKFRVRAKQRFSRKLGEKFPHHTVSIVGSSVTLLSRKDSALDLCVLPLCVDEEEITLDEQGQSSLLGKTTSTVKELFENHNVVNRTCSSVLRCTKPCEAFVESGYPKGLILELNASWQSLMKATLVSTCVKTYPDLLPLLRLVHRLGHFTAWSRAESGIHSNALVILLLVFCAREELVCLPSVEEVQSTCVRTAKGLVEDGKALQEWEKVISILNSKNPGPVARCTPEERPPSDATLGTILLKFLKSYGELLESVFPEPFADVLGMRSPADFLTDEQRHLSRDHVLQTFHFLALHSDVQVVLALCGSEVHRVLFLSPALSCTMRGQERSNARRLSRKTGARITIRPKPSASSYALILEARGSYAALAATEREVERLAIRAARDKVSLMSLCFVQGASLMLFEGSGSDDNHVTLEPYLGKNHQTHDHLEPHVPLLKHSPSVLPTSASRMSCRNFRLFKRKFFTQLVAVNQDFVPDIHGELEFAVHFGRVYVFSVPKSFVWDPRPVTVCMLKTNLRRRSRDQARQPQRNNQVEFHDENAARRRAPQRRTTRQTDKDVKKKKKKEKPCRSSFFTVVHSKRKAINFLHRRGFREVPEEKRESFSVTFKTESQFCTQLDQELKFREITFPNLRWCLTDVKRTYRENHKDEDADGIEVDFRFLLQSRRCLLQRDIHGTEYEKYQEPLKATTEGRPFAVKEEVWKDVSIIRHKKTVVYRTQHPSLNNLTVFSSEVTEYSRPASQPSDFKTTFSRHEVKLKPRLPDDWADKEAVEKFLQNIWDFAFDFSSSISE